MEWKHGKDITARRLLDLYQFISQYKSITESHSVDYFTENHWERLIPEGWKKDLLSLSQDDYFLYPKAHTESRSSTSSISLGDFLLSIQSLKLLSSDQSQEAPPPAPPPDPSCVGQYGMSMKKVHEVNRMSEYLESVLIRPLNIKQMIDIGSGKGYLSETLSFSHQLKVVGIESQPVTTLGALERCRKVEKFFKSHPKEKVTSNKEKGDEKEDRKKIEHGCDPFDDFDSLHLPFEETLTLSETESTSHDTLTKDNNCINKGLEDISITTAVISVQEENTTPVEAAVCTIESSGLSKQNENCDAPSNITGSQNPLNNKEITASDKGMDNDTSTGTNAVSSSHTQPVPCPLTDSYTPITHYISGSDSIIDIAGGAIDTTRPLGLVGLHTCGDLASVILRQFIKEPLIQCVCIVGCCYHHITEREDVTDAVPGFPMSQFLKGHGAFLGRNTRMLSCQSEAHFSTVTSGKALESIFFRAVLQVILQKEMKLIQTPQDARELLVGRVKKYNSFTDYVRRALKRLNIREQNQPSNDRLEYYYTLLLPRLTELQRYLQVRAVIAPLIESLVLLDRLLFLQEHQEECNIKEAWLSQLFVPAISPRCIALSAIRH
ncbi:PREDICTED: methyltransferase-like protein 25 [Amphimedon queenslandica]|uniref:Methyltransferase domain-containing protein n=1 Tax=Amphimedon queenslandica TaxID=400682 RepID=A0A1X7UNH4_AMPQE|nr:PREDICTED: methyltransferase-like protein 25 [Amphimedon queenslandica]|eukprot:XP_011404464.1 PREDICTED: methyltransferase-like protein 25 [Amphimedon queenslandica]